MATRLTVDERLGLPVVVDGGVARLSETSEGVVAETWVPDERAWIRGIDDLASVLSAPPASAELLAHVGLARE